MIDGVHNTLMPERVTNTERGNNEDLAGRANSPYAASERKAREISN